MFLNALIIFLLENYKIGEKNMEHQPIIGAYLVISEEEKIARTLEQIIICYDFIIFYIVLIISIILMFKALKMNNGKVITKKYNILLIINICFTKLTEYYIYNEYGHLPPDEYYDIILLYVILIIQIIINVWLLLIPISLIRKSNKLKFSNS